MKRATASEDGSRVVDGTSAVWDVVDFTFKSDYDSEWERIENALSVENPQPKEERWWFPDDDVLLTEDEAYGLGYIWDYEAQDMLDMGYKEEDVADIEEGKKARDDASYFDEADEDSAMRGEANAYMDAEETASARHC